MKFLRNLLAATFVFAAVIGLGFVWRATPAKSIVADGRGDEGRPPAGAVQPGQFPPRGPDRGGHRDRRRRDSGGFTLGNIDEVAQTLVIYGVVIASVVVADKRRRVTRQSSK